MEIIPFTTEEDWLRHRSADVTSTEISALFDLSPYNTPFELWHRKQGKLVVAFEETVRSKWGQRLEDTIAQGICADYNFMSRRMREYIRDPERRIGASFDYQIFDDSGRCGLLEIKNVDSLRYKDTWTIDESDVEAPPHIELQVQQQLYLSGFEFAYIGAFVGGNRVALIKRTPDASIIEQILNRARRFWHSVEMDRAPQPDFTKDSAIISKIYGFAEPGKVVDLEADEELTRLAMEYKDFRDQAKKFDQLSDERKALILMKINNAEKVLGDGFSVTASMVGPAKIAYDRDGYRTFRVNWKKPKKES